MRPTHARQPQVTYLGAPQLMPILGSSMSYVDNATRKVIRDGSTYYVYDQGLWFSSASTDGPWQAAHDVPGEVIDVECAILSPANPARIHQLCAVPFPDYAQFVR
jgi:hypothetical protein